MSEAVCPRCGAPYPPGVPCPGCGDFVNASANEMSVGVNGERLCNHYALPVTFVPFGKARYRAVMPGDGSVIHVCAPTTARSSGSVRDLTTLSEAEIREELLEQFSRRSQDARDKAIAAARAQPFADSLLAEMLARAEPVYDGLRIAAYLGDLHGDAGTAALRGAVARTGPGVRDLKCAALLGLAKRCGEEATPWLRDALVTIRDGAVKDYAVLGLAGAGTDLAWDDVFAYFSKLTLKTARFDPSPLLSAVAYLGQYVRDDERRARLVNRLRTYWSRRTIEERDWLKGRWPAATPEGPPVEDVEPPDASDLRSWARGDLFSPTWL